VKELFDESAGGRIAWRPVQQLDVQLGASQNESFGVIDFGVVHVKFAAGAVVPPGAEQRIDQDVQVLPDVVAGGDEAMGGRGRIVLIEQLAAHLQGDDLAAQPREHHVVRCERPGYLATSAVRAQALSSVPRLSDGTRMLLDQKFKWGERGCWNDQSKPFWERCEPRWQTGLAPLFSCADGTDPPHKQAAGFDQRAGDLFASDFCHEYISKRRIRANLRGGNR
jgi:hypothetical protein